MDHPPKKKGKRKKERKEFFFVQSQAPHETASENPERIYREPWFLYLVSILFFFFPFWKKQYLLGICQWFCQLSSVQFKYLKWAPFSRSLSLSFIILPKQCLLGICIPWVLCQQLCLQCYAWMQTLIFHSAKTIHVGYLSFSVIHFQDSLSLSPKNTKSSKLKDWPWATR